MNFVLFLINVFSRPFDKSYNLDFTLFVDILDLEGFSPLHLASVYGARKAVEFLIHKEAINVRGYGGRTPLHLTVRTFNIVSVYYQEIKLCQLHVG